MCPYFCNYLKYVFKIFLLTLKELFITICAFLQQTLFKINSSVSLCMGEIENSAKFKSKIITIIMIIHFKTEISNHEIIFTYLFKGK